MLGFGLGLHQHSATLGATDTERASVNYDFTTGTLPMGILVQRASAGAYTTATGHFETAMADVARFDHDGITGALRGLLLEEERTNTVLHSAASTGDWNARNLSASDLSLNALGLFDGTEIVSTNKYWGQLEASCTLEAGIDHTITLYVRAGTVSTCRAILVNGSTKMFATGTLASMGVEREDQGVSMSVIGNALMLDGITRQLTFRVSSTQTKDFDIGFGPNSSTVGDSVVLLAAQVEIGAEHSSYVATHGAVGARAADQLVLSDLTGVYDLTLAYDGGAQFVLPAVGLSPNVSVAAPAGHLRHLHAAPAP